MSILDLSTAFQKLVDQGQKQLDVFNKQLDPINKLANESFGQFSSILQMAGKEINERTIETKIQGEASPRYSTNITNTGDIVNQFPNQTPAQNDLYWARHTQLVDGVLANRQATIDKIIDTIGTTIKGTINPVSFSPVDLIQLINTFKEIPVKR